MRSNQAIHVLLAGLFVMLFSGLGGYWWASHSSPDTQITTRKTTNREDASFEDQTESSSPDTSTLTPSNWEAFLEYEGERSPMLGIKKSYSTVNFRSGPGTVFSIVETPEGGSLLLQLDQVGKWYRSRSREGTIGWIHRSLVRTLQVPEPIHRKFRDDLPPLKESSRELIPEEFKEHNRVRVLETKINIRQGPGVQFPTAGQLYKHQEVRLMGKRNDWFRILSRYGSTGWVRDDLVEVVWQTKPENQPIIKINTQDVRMGPEFQFRKPKPSETPISVRLLEEQSQWFLIKNKNAIGWVHERELTEGPQPPTE